MSSRHSETLPQKKKKRKKTKEILTTTVYQAHETPPNTMLSPLQAISYFILTTSFGRMNFSIFIIQMKQLEAKFIGFPVDQKQAQREGRVTRGKAQG
jgi:hypothetical protein